MTSFAKSSTERIASSPRIPGMCIQQMISVAVEGPEGAENRATTVDLGSPAAEAIWVVG